jgi:hypothetical protein
MSITISQVWNGIIKGVPRPKQDTLKVLTNIDGWLGFKVWCRVNGKKPSAGVSVREYCTTHPKGMIQ